MAISLAGPGPLRRPDRTGAGAGPVFDPRGRRGQGPAFLRVGAREESSPAGDPRGLEGQRRRQGTHLPFSSRVRIVIRQRRRQGARCMTNAWISPSVVALCPSPLPSSRLPGSVLSCWPDSRGIRRGAGEGTAGQTLRPARGFTVEGPGPGIDLHPHVHSGPGPGGEFGGQGRGRSSPTRPRPALLPSLRAARRGSGRDARNQRCLGRWRGRRSESRMAAGEARATEEALTATAARLVEATEGASVAVLPSELEPLAFETGLPQLSILITTDHLVVGTFWVGVGLFPTTVTATATATATEIRSESDEKIQRPTSRGVSTGDSTPLGLRIHSRVRHPPRASISQSPQPVPSLSLVFTSLISASSELTDRWAPSLLRVLAVAAVACSDLTDGEAAGARSDAAATGGRRRGGTATGDRPRVGGCMSTAAASAARGR
uniref:Uncharacterized protein n=2 Tax=Oryza sativa subsp. japonica TaxID=39947 RepID=Q75G89_ORYSJ|nr:unknown protein [Oryza sativa Japonica Group]